MEKKITFIKSLKTELIGKYDFKLDKYMSKPLSPLFYKRIGPIYIYLYFFNDKGTLDFNIQMFFSRVIVSPIYDYGGESPIVKMSWPLSYTKDLDSDSRLPNSFDITEYEDLKLAAHNIGSICVSTLNKYMDNEYHNLNNSDELSKEGYLIDLVDQFNNLEYLHLDEEQFIINLKKNYKNYNDRIIKHYLNRSLSFKQYPRYTTAYEMFSKKFERLLKTDLSIKSKFLLFSVFQMRIPTGILAVDEMLRIDENKRGAFGRQDAYQYSAFMTYLEKAY